MEFLRCFTTVLRWIAVLPAVALAAWFASMVTPIVGSETFSLIGIDPQTSAACRFAVASASHFIIGAAAVYAGALVAPDHQPMIAFGLAGMLILVACVSLFQLAPASYRLAISDATTLMIGAAVATWSWLKVNR